MLRGCNRSITRLVRGCKKGCTRFRMQPNWAPLLTRQPSLLYKGQGRAVGLGLIFKELKQRGETYDARVEIPDQFDYPGLAVVEHGEGFDTALKRFAFHLQ